MSEKVICNRHHFHKHCKNCPCNRLHTFQRGCDFGSCYVLGSNTELRTRCEKPYRIEIVKEDDEG